MKRYLPFYLLGAAILAVGVVSFGLPVSSLWILGLVVLCPLMMMMMGGMHGGGGDGTAGHGGTDGLEAQKSRDGTEERSRPSWLDR